MKNSNSTINESGFYYDLKFIELDKTNDVFHFLNFKNTKNILFLRLPIHALNGQP